MGKEKWEERPKTALALVCISVVGKPQVLEEKCLDSTTHSVPGLTEIYRIRLDNIHKAKKNGLRNIRLTNGKRFSASCCHYLNVLRQLFQFARVLKNFEATQRKILVIEHKPDI